MIKRKKLQQVIFFIMFLNCFIIVCVTCLSLSSEHWVLVKPYRQNYLKLDEKFLSDANSEFIDKNSKSFIYDQNGSPKLLLHLMQKMENRDLNYYGDLLDSSENENIMPIDLHAKKNCKRYNGKIQFGLFRGIWLLNYGYGCKNRAYRVSSKK